MKNARMRGRRGRPIRLDDSDRILSREECEHIAKRVERFARGGGDTQVRITSWWQGQLRWARSRVSLACDRRNVAVRVIRGLSSGLVSATTNQLDEASLEAAVRAAERETTFTPVRRRIADGLQPPPPAFDYPETTIWSDATYNVATESREELVRPLMESAEAAGVLSAGYLEVRAQAVARLGSQIRTLYAACTQAQCSTTVRDPRGMGSGWAGLSSYDWGKIDGAALGERALEKALASRMPVAIEPGRYTVILSPRQCTIS